MRPLRRRTDSASVYLFREHETRCWTGRRDAFPIGFPLRLPKVRSPSERFPIRRSWTIGKRSDQAYAGDVGGACGHNYGCDADMPTRLSASCAWERMSIGYAGWRQSSAASGALLWSSARLAGTCSRSTRRIAIASRQAGDRVPDGDIVRPTRLLGSVGRTNYQIIEISYLSRNRHGFAQG